MKKQLISEQSGFTLVEVMAAMGLVGFAIFGFMKLSEQSSQSAQSQVLANDFDILANNVSVAINSDCQHILQQTPFHITATPIATFSSLAFPALPSPIPIASVGFPSVGTQVTSMQINKVIGSDLVTLGHLHEVLANFNLQAQKVSSANLPGSQFYSKDFKLVLWYNDQINQVIDCEQSQDLSISLVGPSPNCVPAGVAMALDWTASGAEGIVFNGGTVAAPYTVPSPLPNPYPSGSYSGQLTVTPTMPGPVVYTATAYGNAGQTLPAYFTVTPSPVCPPCTAVGTVTFTVTPNTGVAAGQPLTMNWSAPNATSITILPSPGPVPVAGPTTISALGSTTTYSLIAGNSCGTAAPVSVTVTSSTGCTCGSSNVCTNGQTTYADSCGNNRCPCSSQTCSPPAPTCASGNPPACSGSTWSCPGG